MYSLLNSKPKQPPVVQQDDNGFKYDTMVEALTTKRDGIGDSASEIFYHEIMKMLGPGDLDKQARARKSSYAAGKVMNSFPPTLMLDAFRHFFYGGDDGSTEHLPIAPNWDFLQWVKGYNPGDKRNLYGMGWRTVKDVGLTKELRNICEGLFGEDSVGDINEWVDVGGFVGACKLKRSMHSRHQRSSIHQLADTPPSQQQ